MDKKFFSVILSSHILIMIKKCLILILILFSTSEALPAPMCTDVWKIDTQISQMPAVITSQKSVDLQVSVIRLFESIKVRELYKDRIYQSKFAIEELARKLLKTKDWSKFVYENDSAYVIKTLEEAFQKNPEFKYGKVRSTLHAISLYKVLKNIDEAAIIYESHYSSLNQESKVYFNGKLESVHRPPAYPLENLSGPISFLFAFGVGYALREPGVTPIISLLTALGSGLLMHHFLHPTLELASTGLDKIMTSVRQYSYKRNLKQYLKDETDAEKRELFAHRFDLWREKIQMNMQTIKDEYQLATQNVLETASLLHFDFSLLTLPFKMTKDNFSAKDPEFTKLVKEFETTVQLRRNYLSSVIEVLRHAVDRYQDLPTPNDSQTSSLSFALLEQRRDISVGAVKELLVGLALSEQNLNNVLAIAQNSPERLPQMIKAIQDSDARIEALLVGR